MSLLLAGCGDRSEGGDASDEDSRSPSGASVRTVAAVTEERKELDATIFANETEAQRYEQVFVALWDRLRSEDPFEVLKAFEFEQLELGTPVPIPGNNEWGVEGIRPAALQEPFKTIPRSEFLSLLEDYKAAGWRIAQTEWHHTRFEPAADGKPPRSLVSFEIHALYGNENQPLLLKGGLEVEWKADGSPTPTRLSAPGLKMTARKGSPMFTPSFVVDPKVEVPSRYPRTTPLLVHDLDGDGLSEIVTAGCNLLYRNRGGMKFERTDFLAHPIPRPAEAGILADFTGDGVVDYIGGSLDTGSLLLFAGSAQGTFPHEPTVVFPEKLTNLHALTAGDIDRDGDLDLFAGQWKAPYAGGSMPTPYYDANDGHPDYLLRNDGGGSFTDITEEAGLAPLRLRRTFSSSFIDLDNDDDLDLVVVADFSGLDLHYNQGDGTFKEAAAKMSDQRHSFGMSHTFDDWNADGNIDLYMVGMSSTTARRLDGLGLGRPGFEKYSEMRAPMTFGNRLLEGDGKGRFRQPPLAASAARTGWAWGCTSADFDLDGDADLYVANGHLSGDSAKDYCTRFWCHDLYTGNSKPNPILNDFFEKELKQKLGREYSWNGFEHNVLYLNQPGIGFFNAAFLLGVAFEFDSRAVASDDLDGDGRPDLLVVEYRTASMSQRLHVLRNQYQSGHHWIGLHLPSGPGGGSPLGTRATVRMGDRAWTKVLVTGDSFTAQHPTSLHFGLGSATGVDSVTIRWPNGEESVLESPEIDRYHYPGGP